MIRECELNGIYIWVCECELNNKVVNESVKSWNYIHI